MNILAELRDRFVSALQPLVDDPSTYADMIKVSQDARFGDFQANCAMPLAKKLGKPPREVAGQILDALEVSDLCDPPEVAGPGFINLSLRSDWLVRTFENMRHSDRLGIEVPEEPRRIVIDYSSPNVAKPMHVGHLRSTVIGSALERILRYLGHSVISDNHIGDWGTQFGMIIYGYKNFLDDSAYALDAVAELSRLYRLVNQLGDYQSAVETRPAAEARLEAAREGLKKAEAAAEDDKKARKLLKKQRSSIDQLSQHVRQLDATIDSVRSDAALLELAQSHSEISTAARLETARLHQGDPENLALWHEFMPACRRELNALYERLEISFDETLGESFYQPMLDQVVERLRERELAKVSHGATCVFLENHDAPFIVQKSDGAFTYATTDLATIDYRVSQWNADQILYVVDDRQSEHFQMLFETARQSGLDQLDFRHVSFGKILGDDRRPFKTRSGETVGLGSLLDEAVRRAREIVDENDDAKPEPELDSGERARIAEIVGIGGIKYADLHHNRDSDYVFDWQKMLATTGDTATYIQYAYARICGIFRRGGIDRSELSNQPASLVFDEPAERSLAVLLLRFPEILQSVTNDFRPNILTDYLYSTADGFSAFFRDCPVLKADSEDIRTSRLHLCNMAGRILHQGLALLGIHTAEKM